MKKLTILLMLLMAGSVMTLSAADKESRTDIPSHHSKKSHFAWGADLSSSIDMTGNAMTSTNIGAYFGYRNSWFHLLGIGGDIHFMMSNSSRAIPVFAIAQTSFCSRPRLCFMDARVGISMNNYESMNTQTGFYGSLGVGVNLAHSSKFASHIVVGYSFIPRKDFESDGAMVHLEDLHFATVRIGVCF
ncbi:MAG: hypothetical protein K2O00_03500 [Muribaculaceae bacterium]|nr:hypothetical protein [Muribaculaceae bacterium]